MTGLWSLACAFVTELRSLARVFVTDLCSLVLVLVTEWRILARAFVTDLILIINVGNYPVSGILMGLNAPIIVEKMH